MRHPSARSVGAVLAVLAVLLPTSATGITSRFHGTALISAGPEIIVTLLTTAALGWRWAASVQAGGWRRAIGVGGAMGAVWFPLFYLAWLAAGLAELVVTGTVATLDVPSAMVLYALLYFWLIWLYSLAFAVPIGILWGILTHLVTRPRPRGPRWPETASPAR